ncbi:type II toxin-antitoxin system RelE/ParE family toxin [Leptospira interrogans]|uniref:type II toxin-antitoxin system RelE family toxin n=1 Tax=Leptospira interrogans TaxID=173 RepID=UPI0012B5BAE0
MINSDFVEKEIKNFPKPDKEQIQRALGNLKSNGINHSKVESLTGTFYGAYRMKVGNYRIMFCLNETTKEIEIMKIGQRENFYKRR